MTLLPSNINILYIQVWWRRGYSLTACKATPPVKSKMAARGAPKSSPGSGKVSTTKFLGPLVNFHKISF